MAYTPRAWALDDAITDTELNRMEAGIVTAYAGIVPTGGVVPYAGTTAPAGWLLCDGAAVSRATYDDLFDVVSTTYGVGDGSTTFNVPNLKGNVPVGLNSADTAFDALGETGGSADAILVAHTHTTQLERVRNTLLESGHGPGIVASNNYYEGQRYYDLASSSSGVSGTDKNLQPYLVLNYIIKT